MSVIARGLDFAVCGFVGAITGGGAGYLLLFIVIAPMEIPASGESDLEYLAFCALFGFIVGGMLLGCLGAGLCRNRRSWLGLGFGTALGYTASLAFAFVRAPLIHHDTSSGQQCKDGLMICALALLLCAAGAICGMVVTSLLKPKKENADIANAENDYGSDAKN